MPRSARRRASRPARLARLVCRGVAPLERRTSKRTPSTRALHFTAARGERAQRASDAHRGGWWVGGLRCPALVGVLEQCWRPAWCGAGWRAGRRSGEGFGVACVRSTPARAGGGTSGPLGRAGAERAARLARMTSVWEAEPAGARAQRAFAREHAAPAWRSEEARRAHGWGAAREARATARGREQRSERSERARRAHGVSGPPGQAAHDSGGGGSARARPY